VAARRDVPNLADSRVLIVEDDPTTREALARLLARLGATVESAENLRDGLSALREWKPAVVILDLMLPDGDGSTLLEVVRAERLPVKVILASAAHGPLFTAAEAFLPDEIMPKPYDAVTLAKRIAALV
jgi:DNA-binding response OmpR family regulator